MVKNFEDFVNEGMWKSGVERAKSGEKRIEDMSDFEKYLNHVEWMDIGHEEYLFAKYDIYEEPNANYYEDTRNNFLFSIVEIKDIEKSLPKGVYIMNDDDIEWIKENGYIGSNGHTVCASYGTKNKKFIYFSKPINPYFLCSLKIDEDTQYVACKTLIGNQREIRTGHYSINDKKYRFKLVKRK